MIKTSVATTLLALSIVAGSAVAGQPISLEQAPPAVREAVQQGALLCTSQNVMGTRLSNVTLCRPRSFQNSRQMLLTDTGLVEYRPNQLYTANLDTGVGG